MGDRDVTIRGERVCAYVRRRFFKYDFGDVGAPDSVIEIRWLKFDLSDVQCGDLVVWCGRQFKIKNDPEDLYTGWYRAELVQQCGAC